MSQTLYSNGPLPEFLQEDAFVSQESNEFLLSPAAARQYLDWCLRGNLAVVGMEAFQKGPEGVTPVDDASCEAGAHECKECLTQLTDALGADFLVSIWVTPEK
jgi:hypothetical protein